MAQMLGERRAVSAVLSVLLLVVIVFLSAFFSIMLLWVICRAL